MELSSLKEIISDEGVWFTPVFPDGSKCDFSFRVVGRNTEEYRRAIHRNALKLSSNRKKDAEEAIDSADVFVACVKDWQGITVDGKDYLCTKENKVAMYKDAKLKWLCEQIEQYIIQDDNFLSVKA